MSADQPPVFLAASSLVSTRETTRVFWQAVVEVIWGEHIHAGGLGPLLSSASSIEQKCLSGNNLRVARLLLKCFPCHAWCRFGQCWVFAGVAVSMLRALGIPCRPVTCYNAAHCVQKLGKVDRYFSAEGDLIASIGRDQIW